MNTHLHDTDEIQKFTALAHQWWDKEGALTTLHAINPARMTFLTQHTELQQKRVLDLGCGGGILSESLARAGAHVTGIDLSPDVIQVARDHAQEQALDIQYECIDVADLTAQKPGYFDIVVCMEMLEHVPNPALIVEYACQLVKPGGELFLSTINRTPKAYVFAILGAEYILNILPRKTHDYHKFIQPAELIDVLRTQHAHVQTLQGMQYNPFTKTTRLSDDVSVNYLLHATLDASNPGVAG